MKRLVVALLLLVLNAVPAFATPPCADPCYGSANGGGYAKFLFDPVTRGVWAEYYNRKTTCITCYDNAGCARGFPALKGQPCAQASVGGYFLMFALHNTTPHIAFSADFTITSAWTVITPSYQTIDGQDYDLVNVNFGSTVVWNKINAMLTTGADVVCQFVGTLDANMHLPLDGSGYMQNVMYVPCPDPAWPGSTCGGNCTGAGTGCLFVSWYVQHVEEL